MRLWPRSLIGRTIVVVLGAVLVSNAVALALFTYEREKILADALGARLAQRVASVVDVLEETPAAHRPRWLRPMRRPGFRLFWAPRPLTEEGRADWRINVIYRAILENLADPDPARLTLSYQVRDDDSEVAHWLHVWQRRHIQAPGAETDGEQDRPMAAGLADILYGSYQLTDGTWLNFAVWLPSFPPFWATPFFLPAVVTTIVVLIVTVWAVWRASAPLAMFARAAERLGHDVNAPPLDETGPGEVESAAHAFNEMQRRLQAFVRARVQMLAALSHDLRTPITRLRLRAELDDDGERRARLLSDLDQIEEMITATLAFARGEFDDEPPVSVDLAVLLRGVCEESEDAGCDVRYGGPDHAPIVGRPMGLRRAFANLIDNAVKYGERARVRLAVSGGRAVVTVEDDGPGIPEEWIERVFEPFVRVEQSRSRETGGVGLGLAVVRSVIGAHGGALGLANRASGGLTVTVALPQAPGAIAAAP